MPRQRERSYGITLRAQQDDGFGFEDNFEEAPMARYSAPKRRGRAPMSRYQEPMDERMPTGHRYVSRTSVVATNDPGVKLQNFAKSGYDFVSLAVGGGLAAFAVYYLGEAVSIMLKLGIGAAIGFVGYQYIKAKRGLSND